MATVISQAVVGTPGGAPPGMQEALMQLFAANEAYRKEKRLFVEEERLRQAKVLNDEVGRQVKDLYAGDVAAFAKANPSMFDQWTTINNLPKDPGQIGVEGQMELDRRRAAQNPGVFGKFGEKTRVVRAPSVTGGSPPVLTPPVQAPVSAAVDSGVKQVDPRGTNVNAAYAGKPDREAPGSAPLSGQTVNPLQRQQIETAIQEAIYRAERARQANLDGRTAFNSTLDNLLTSDTPRGLKAYGVTPQMVEQVLPEILRSGTLSGIPGQPLDAAQYRQTPSTPSPNPSGGLSTLDRMATPEKNVPPDAQSRLDQLVEEVKTLRSTAASDPVAASELAAKTQEMQTLALQLRRGGKATAPAMEQRVVSEDSKAAPAVEPVVPTLARLVSAERLTPENMSKAREAVASAGKSVRENLVVERQSFKEFMQTPEASNLFLRTTRALMEDPESPVYQLASALSPKTAKDMASAQQMVAEARRTIALANVVADKDVIAAMKQKAINDANDLTMKDKELGLRREELAIKKKQIEYAAAVQALGFEIQMRAESAGISMNELSDLVKSMEKADEKTKVQIQGLIDVALAAKGLGTQIVKESWLPFGKDTYGVMPVDRPPQAPRPGQGAVAKIYEDIFGQALPDLVKPPAEKSSADRFESARKKAGIK